MRFDTAPKALTLACLAAWAVSAAAPVLAQPANPYPLSVVAPQPADWPARVGRVAELQGMVWYYDREEGTWVQAQPNLPLTSGDRLSVEPGARALLRIGATSLRLGAATDLTLRRIDDQLMAIDLDGGSLAITVPGGDLRARMEVNTADGRFVPQSAGLYRIDRRGSASEGSALRGQLMFDSSDSQLPIGAGQHAQFWQQGMPPSTHYRTLPMDRDEFAGWVQRAEVDASRSQTARYVSPEMTGWEDLDRYGSWASSPEYGNVWIPANVTDNWAPYQDGRWVWAQPWGWTWVDAAPWGFAPFHYGRWVRWGLRWVWTPGEREHHPRFAPALVSWTPPPQREWRDHRPPPPSRWVPLLPHEVYRPQVQLAVPPVPRDRVVPLPPHRGADPGRREGDRPERTLPGRPAWGGQDGERAGHDRPGLNQPGADRPNTDRPNTDRPGSDRPNMDRPSDPRRPGIPPAVPVQPQVQVQPPAQVTTPPTPVAPPHDRRVPRGPVARPQPPVAPTPAPQAVPDAATQPAPRQPPGNHRPGNVPAAQPGQGAVIAPPAPARAEPPRHEAVRGENKAPAAPVVTPPAVPPVAAPEARRRAPEQNESPPERKNQR